MAPFSASHAEPKKLRHCPGHKGLRLCGNITALCLCFEPDRCQIQIATKRRGNDTKLSHSSGTGQMQDHIKNIALPDPDTQIRGQDERPLPYVAKTLDLVGFGLWQGLGEDHRARIFERSDASFCAILQQFDQSI